MFFNVVSSTAIVMCVCVLRFAVCMSWCCEPAGLFDVQLKLPRASVAPGMHTGVAGAQLPQRKHEEEEDGWATRRADFFASSRAGASRRHGRFVGTTGAPLYAHCRTTLSQAPMDPVLAGSFMCVYIQRAACKGPCDSALVIAYRFESCVLFGQDSCSSSLPRASAWFASPPCWWGPTAPAHAVATLGGLIFGAAEARALPLSRTSLDRCVGAHLNGECFSHVARLRREAQA